MRFLLSSALLAAVLSTVLAAPAPAPAAKQHQGRSFTVHRVRNADFAGYDPAAEMARAFGKYGMDLPAGFGKGPTTVSGVVVDDGTVVDTNQHDIVTSTVYVYGNGLVATPTSSSSYATPTGNAGGESGEVNATPQPNDVEYLSPVIIGGQTIHMDFDTGSSDLWVFNTELPASSQAGRVVYNPSLSPTFKLLQGESFKITYGDGSGVSGNVGTDVVNIGGADFANQAVELAQNLSGSFLKDMANNGLVGLAFSKLNTVKPNKQKTFFENVMPELKEPVFTANLKAGANGDYEFGAIDNSKFSGDLSWAPIDTTNGFWQVSSQQFSVNGGTPIQVPGGIAILDTGTTLMLVNSAIVNGYYTQVQGAANDPSIGGVTFPCNATLPDLQVAVGDGYMANIPGHLINFAPVDFTGQSKSSFLANKCRATVLTGDTACFGSVQATGSKLQIFGDILFKAQFVAFNGGNNSVGIAPHNQGGIQNA